MGVLQRFERRLEGLVEGAFAKAFRSNVQPVEVAGALQREADDRAAIVSAGRTLIPNDYVVELGDADFDRLQPYEEPLTDEFAAMVREHAVDRGYSFVGPVHVRLARITELDTGVFRVRSDVVAGASVDGGVMTGGPVAPAPEARPPAAPPSAAPAPPEPPAASAGPQAPAGAARPDQPRLRVGQAGDAFPLTQPVTVVGRGADSDLRINDPGVSRRHCEFRKSAEGVVLSDLGSTNGTTVNGRQVSRAVLHGGERITVGGTTLVFQAGADAPNGR